MPIQLAEFNTIITFLGCLCATKQFVIFSALFWWIFSLALRVPLELNSLSFNVHTWISIPLIAVFAWKTWLSYFDKPKLYRKKRWLGPAMFSTWAFTWITAATSYYVRTLPSNPQHAPPSFLLPYRLMVVQIAMPFVLGALITWPILVRFRKRSA